LKDEDKEFLEHFGIPGMKWGRRKRSNEERDQAHKLAKKYTDSMDKKLAKKASDRYLQDEIRTAHKLAKKYTDSMDKKAEKSQREYEKAMGHPDNQKKIEIKRKRLKDMSNAELKELNNRLQLEKQYKDLTKGEKSAGRKFAEDILKEIGKELVKESIKNGIKSIKK
jgi:hypothetical protein